MVKYITPSLKGLALLSMIVLLLASCVSQKKIKYIQKKAEGDTATTFNTKPPENYKVQTNDNLYIRIYSLDEKVNTVFNRSNNVSYGSYAYSQSYFDSYTVSLEGYIEFPVIGKVYVRDLTLEQIRALVQQLVDEYLKETVVVVKMSIYNITILGEVKNPGEYQIYQDKINIFEAISRAGDLTDFANRNKISIIRQIKNQSKIMYVDLTDEKILSSEYYYLAPNDIIYASPLRVKQYGFASFPYALVFTSITTILALLTFIKVY